MSTFRRSLAAAAISITAGAFAALVFHGSFENLISKKEPTTEPSGSSTVASRQIKLREALESRFQSYLTSRSRHSYTLLQEVVACYMRADAAECLDTLRSLNALALVSPSSLAGIDSQVDVRDFASLLKVASTVNPQSAEALITKGFQQLISSDPLKAFEYLSFLPSNLRDKLGVELAESWGKRDGPGASNAFYKSGLRMYEGLSAIALTAWAQSDLEGAYRHLLSMDVLGEKSDRQLGAFVRLLGRKDARLGAKLLAEHGGEMPEQAQVGCRSLVMDLARQDGEKALAWAGSLPTDKLRYQALWGIIATAVSSDSSATQLALRAAMQLPISEYSLRDIRLKTADIAEKSANPFSLTDQIDNVYQREAAAVGVIQGIVARKGLAGLQEVVERGLSSKQEGWLEAAGSAILAPADVNEFAAAIVAAGGKPKTSEARDWKLLPPEVKNALLRSANANWAPEKVRALQQKLGQ
ncbi:MAG: hypothetical protein V4710_18725 [Verrucomicrobiota bacterium]